MPATPPETTKMVTVVMKKYVIAALIRKDTIIRYFSKFTVILLDKTFLTVLNGIISCLSSHQLQFCVYMELKSNGGNFGKMSKNKST